MKLRHLCLHTLSVLAVSFAAAASTAAACDEEEYPRSWWTEVPRDGAPSWEILPQDAAPGEVILSKRTELGVFSNFAATPIEIDGVRYASLEGFWQMMKYPEGPNDPRASVPGITWPYTREQVGQLAAFEAKEAGDVGSNAMRALGINYVTYQGRELPYRIAERGEHYDLIVRATRAKLEQHPQVKALLLRTGDLVLKPDHTQGPDTPPAWKYYEIWTMLRAELQANTKAASH
jgi:predicted NAD-dependent protein-ADP-ribosyltransferase YbiA (DUF1768 family)